MTLEQFIAANSGKFLDYDAHFGPQCVDLINFYCVQVLGVPIAWVVGAIDWYGKDQAFLSWSRNVWGSRTSKPPRGAIVVWGANARAGTGVYGHIAICTDPGDGLSFVSFDQNYPPNSRCHLQRHRYDGVIGWGDKPKPPVPAPPPPAVDPCAGVKEQLVSARAQLQKNTDALAAYRTAVSNWAAGVPR